MIWQKLVSKASSKPDRVNPRRRNYQGELVLKLVVWVMRLGAISEGLFTFVQLVCSVPLACVALTFLGGCCCRRVPADPTSVAFSGPLQSGVGGDMG